MQQLRHIIHQQSLEVAFERPGQKPGIQERLAAVHYQRILPGLDQVFGEFEAELPDGLTIPIVSIDCGILHEANWEDELAATVFNKIKEELQQYRNSPKDDKQLASQWNSEFIQFLQTGRYPWDSRREVPADYERRLVLDEMFLDKLTAALQTADDVLKRLFYYCSAEFIIRLAEALSVRHIPPEGWAYVSFLKEAGVESAVWPTAVVSAYCAAYCRPSATKVSFAIALTEMVWPKIDTIQRTDIVQQIARLLTTAKSQMRPQFLVPDFITALLPLLSKDFPEWAAIIRQQGSVEHDEPPAAPVTQLRPIPDSLAHREPNATANRQPDHVIDTYYVTNAGLILAYPFIAPLLQRTDLMNQDGQLTLEARGKATVLLQQLIYEEPLVEEHELPLNKLLVGLQPTSFVDPTILEYTSQIRQECEEVLDAIIAHWSVLRNTTVAGLRETFLQRDGKLTLRADGWLLQVGSRGVDVLLASLPWSIGVIKLPWMDGMLHVEWT